MGCFPDIEVSRHLDVELDHPRSIIETALASCASRTEEAETACVKQALVTHNIAVTALPRLIPGCRAGRDCTVDFTTDNRIGFVPATASDYVVHWRVTVDLKHPGKTIADVPVKVEQI